jgi:hypothetical protein
MWGYKMKEDTGKFGFNKRDWKVTPKTRLYDENYMKIFRKKIEHKKEDKDDK